MQQRNGSENGKETKKCDGRKEDTADTHSDRSGKAIPSRDTQEVRATKMKLGPGLMAPSVRTTAMLSIAADSSIKRLQDMCANSD